VWSQVPLYGSFRDAFRNVSSQIVDKVDVSHGLIDVLYRNGVLLESHVSDIKVSSVAECTCSPHTASHRCTVPTAHEN